MMLGLFLSVSRCLGCLRPTRKGLCLCWRRCHSSLQLPSLWEWRLSYSGMVEERPGTKNPFPVPWLPREPRDEGSRLRVSNEPHHEAGQGGKRLTADLQCKAFWCRRIPMLEAPKHRSGGFNSPTGCWYVHFNLSVCLSLAYVGQRQFFWKTAVLLRSSFLWNLVFCLFVCLSFPLSFQ